MDKTKAKGLLQTVFAEFKKMGTELEAYRLTFAALKETLKYNHPDFPAVADGALAAATVSPPLHEKMRKQFDEPLEKFLAQVSQAQTEEEVEKLLLAMPASKFVN